MMVRQQYPKIFRCIQSRQAKGPSLPTLQCNRDPISSIAGLSRRCNYDSFSILARSVIGPHRASSGGGLRTPPTQEFLLTTAILSIIGHYRSLYVIDYITMLQHALV
jgi:hypothetical protein